jgi:hypothetical protein
MQRRKRKIELGAIAVWTARFVATVLVGALIVGTSNLWVPQFNGTMLRLIAIYLAICAIAVLPWIDSKICLRVFATTLAILPVVTIVLLHRVVLTNFDWLDTAVTLLVTEMVAVGWCVLIWKHS